MKTTHHNLIQAYYQAPWRFQLQLIGLFSLVLVMVALVAGIYLSVTARAATTGREIQEMQADILVIERINADLETQLAQLTSSRTMDRRARDLGFRPITPGEVLYLEISGFVGPQEAVLAPPPGPVAPTTFNLPPEFTQTLFGWLKEFTLQPTAPFAERP